MWRAYPDEGCYDKLDSAALVYQSQGGRYRAQGCMTLGSDSSIVNDPLGEPGRTPMYVGLLSTWSSEDVEQVFCLFSWEGSLIGDCDG